MKLALLSCPQKTAEKISRILLEKKLIVCSKQIDIKSLFLWEGKIEKEKEVLLLMETLKKNFKKIEKELEKIHPYKTFVLSLISVEEVSKEAKKWIEKELN